MTLYITIKILIITIEYPIPLITAMLDHDSIYITEIPTLNNTL